MCGKSVHNFRPRSLLDCFRLLGSYILFLIALSLLSINVIPYHVVYLPMLRSSCVAGEASWLYYYYCIIVIVVLEILVYVDLFLAVFVSPGVVPRDPWAHPPVYNEQVHSENTNEVFDLDPQGKLRYCMKCEQFKPDKAHHCSICGYCVYRKDHHCPWINNCVGRDNTKYFILFLIYIPVGALHIVGTCIYSLTRHFKSVGLSATTEVMSSITLLVMAVGMTVLLGTCFGCMAGHFAFMAFRGETSVSKFLESKLGSNAHGKTRRSKAMLREIHMNDIFGHDRRWWRYLLPFPPVRHRHLQSVNAKDDVMDSTRGFFESLV